MEDFVRRAVPKSGDDWWVYGAFLLVIFFLLLADFGIKWFDARHFLQNGYPANALLVNKYRDFNGDSESRRYLIDVGFYDYSQTEAATTVDRNYTAADYIVPTVEQGSYETVTIRINRRLFNELVYGEPLPIVFLPSDSSKARLLSEVQRFPRWQHVALLGFTLFASLFCFALYHRAKNDRSKSPFAAQPVSEI